MNPWLIIGVLLALMGAATGGYVKGRVDGASKCEERITALKDASQKAKDAEALKANKAATDLEKENADADKQSKEREVIVTKIVERPVYRDRCFDDDGLRIGNEALAGTRSAAPVAPVPMPGPDAP